MNEDDEHSERGVDLGRTLALSDGVFAIAMTLLAFQIKPPSDVSGDGAGLARALGHMADSYYVYALSFAVIGLLWLAHHRTFARIDHADDLLMGLNLVFLMTVAALPFPSAILGDYGNQRSAVILYAAAMAVAGALLTFLNLVVPRHGLMAPTTTVQLMRRGIWLSGSMAAIFALSIPVAVVAPTVAPYMWLGAFVVRVGVRRYLNRRDQLPPPPVEP